MVDYFHVDDDPANIARVVAATVLFFCALELSIMLAYYIRAVFQIRPQIREKEILSPPPGWSLAYHVCVLGFVVVAFVIRLQLAHQNAPVNIGTFFFPVFGIALLMVSQKFHSYWARALQEQLHAEQFARDTQPRDREP